MKILNRYLIIFTVVAITLFNCDPVHSLKLENQTGKKIQMIFDGDLRDNGSINRNRFSKVAVHGKELRSLVLDSAEVIRIGEVIAHYSPMPNDLRIDYLEIEFNKDTIKLIGRNAIFSSLQKVDDLDWRIIIKNK